MRYISDCYFEGINQLIFFFEFLRCHESVHDNIEFSCGNSNSLHESQIMTC